MMYCPTPDRSLAEILLFPSAGIISHAVFILISISLSGKKTVTVTKTISRVRKYAGPVFVSVAVAIEDIDHPCQFLVVFAERSHGNNKYTGHYITT
jgi:hypothetical protein